MPAQVQASVVGAADMVGVKAWLSVPMAEVAQRYAVADHSNSHQCKQPQMLELADKPTSKDVVALLVTTDNHLETLKAIGETNQLKAKHLSKISKVRWVISKVNKVASSLVIATADLSTSPSTTLVTSNMVVNLNSSNYHKVKWLSSNNLSTLVSN